jgi:hypothetical protein
MVLLHLVPAFGFVSSAESSCAPDGIVTQGYSASGWRTQRRVMTGMEKTRGLDTGTLGVIPVKAQGP